MGSVVRQDLGKVADREGLSFHRSSRQGAQLEIAFGGQLAIEAKGQNGQEPCRKTDKEGGRKGCLI